MRFRLPLDDVQYQGAVKTHVQMRANLRELRRRFPPRARDEAAILKGYRDVVQEFARELLKPIDRINPARLNELNDEALLAFVTYASVRGPAD